MKVRKKLLSSLLALAMSFYALPTVWAEDLSQQIQDTPENSCSDTVTTDTAATDAPQTEDEAAEDSVETDIPRDEETTDSEEIFETDPPQTEDEDNSGDSETTPEQDGENSENAPNEDGISVMSLLPMEVVEREVLIDFTVSERGENGICTVKSLLKDILAESGKLDEESNYNGKIVYSYNNNTGYDYGMGIHGEDHYYPIGWNDYIPHFFQIPYFNSQYGWVSTYEFSFILSDDQLNRENIRYDITAHFNNLDSLISFIPYNKNGEPVRTSAKYWQSANPFHRATTYTYVVSADDIKTENGFEVSGFLLDITEEYKGKLEVYIPEHCAEGGIGGVEYKKNITSQVINDGTAKEPYPLDDDMIIELGLFLTLETGIKISCDVAYEVKPEQNSVRLYTRSDGNSYTTDYFTSDGSSTQINVYETVSADNIDVNIYGYYYDYIDENSDGYGYVDPTKIDFACFGNYDSKEAALQAGENDIKDQLFSYSGVPVDKSKIEELVVQGYYSGTLNAKKVTITTIDNYGKVYVNSVYYAFADKSDDKLSDGSYLRVYGAYADDNDSKKLLSYHYINGSDDSYFENGYQTVFLLDRGKPLADGTTIYPEFSKSSGVNVYADGYQGTQTSGESPITFESGKAIQYSAASESGTHLKNYWVTFVTPQSGPKLFVNATNNPDHYSESGKAQREMFLKSSLDGHDIFFANIGDETLSGIKVALSGDAQGVKLDDYWTVIDSSVGTLAPFTKTSSLDNIAKIRLIPVSDDYFGDISGTITISSANGGSQEIELTGIAGIPKITTDKLYDGIKYVPYSSVIMTNSMYGSDSMSFSLYGGSLPDGLELRPNGEIYGIPTKTGEFRFAVEAVYNGAKQENGAPYSCTQYYTIVIADNTDENVDSANTDEQGHPMIEKVSKYITVYYSGENGGKPIVDRIEIDSDLFWSEGALGELQDFYIDGIKLAKGSDYTAEEGSTKITVRAQTFGHIGITGSEVPHTLAAEFRTADTNELKRSAQNVYLNYEKLGGSSNPGGNTGNTGNTGSSGGNGNSNNTGVVPVFNKSSGTVSAVIGIVDADGNPVSGLELELHSKPMYASTDSSGAAKFDSVEFGRHTLYIKNSSNNKKISKTFTIASGSNTGIKGSVITASEGETISLTIEYDGSEIKILSVAEDVSSGSGVHGNGEIAFVISKNIFLKRILILTVIFAAAILASILAVRKRFLTK